MEYVICIYNYKIQKQVHSSLEVCFNISRVKRGRNDALVSISTGKFI